MNHDEKDEEIESFDFFGDSDEQTTYENISYSSDNDESSGVFSRFNKSKNKSKDQTQFHEANETNTLTKPPIVPNFSILNVTKISDNSTIKIKDNPTNADIIFSNYNSNVQNANNNIILSPNNLNCQVSSYIQNFNNTPQINYMNQSNINPTLTPPLFFPQINQNISYMHFVPNEQKKKFPKKKRTIPYGEGHEASNIKTVEGFNVSFQKQKCLQWLAHLNNGVIPHKKTILQNLNPFFRKMPSEYRTKISARNCYRSKNVLFYTISKYEEIFRPFLEKNWKYYNT